jgi:hypothetical protein
MYLWNIIPTPSKTPNRQAQVMAEFLVCLQPPLIAREPPVKKPAMMAFNGSSRFLTALTAQSYVENRPPQTPKLPPTTGTRALMAEIAPGKRSPYGELRKPLIPCQTQPPMTYLELLELWKYRGNRRKTYTHGEGTTEVVKNHNRTRISGMVGGHCFRMYRGRD